MHEIAYGSDLVIDTLQRAGIEYVAINPGASFRGIHESLVSAGDPKLVLALHENVAIATGEGYARSAGKPMGVFIHNLVGIQNGALGIFNAWADQVPILIIGGSGPADAAVRRPWIDWMHSARSQALVARNFLKWDDEPASLEAIPDSIIRASRISTTVPQGPCYVSIDVLLQEAKSPKSIMDKQETLPGAKLANSFTAPMDVLEEIAQALIDAETPVIVADATVRAPETYESLIALAEALAIPVVDLGARFNFPTDHWADGTPSRTELLSNADFVLALDLRDISFGVGEIDHESHGYRRIVPPSARVVSISTNQLMHRGFMDYSGPTGAAEELIADTAVCLPALVTLVEKQSPRYEDRRNRLKALAEKRGNAASTGARQFNSLTRQSVSASIFEAVAPTGEWQIANAHLPSVRSEWKLSKFNAHIGRNVGGGLGYGIGASIGAALAHRDDDTLIVNIQNDGDLMYSASGLWTAARYNLPILTIVINNRMYGQDYMHQTITAKRRNRPLDHAYTGIDIGNPDIDFGQLAAAQGVEGIGQVTDLRALKGALTTAVNIIRTERRPVLIDAIIPR